MQKPTLLGHSAWTAVLPPSSCFFCTQINQIHNMTWLHKHSTMNKYGSAKLHLLSFLTLNLDKSLVEKGHTVFY